VKNKWLVVRICKGSLMETFLRVITGGVFDPDTLSHCKLSDMHLITNSQILWSRILLENLNNLLN
jgi:hypothetical protein